MRIVDRGRLIHLLELEQDAYRARNPRSDAQWVGAELTRRFGLPLWSFTLSATDANRWAMCPDTSRADVDRHTAVFGEVVAALVED